MCDHCGCRAFPPIAELTADHEAILDLAWRVAEAPRTGRLDIDADRDALGAMLAAHVAREEEGLYPLLADLGDLTDNARDALEEEHRDLDAAIAGGVIDRRTYYVLAAHIEHEEMHLFPAAMFAFEDEQWDTMAGVHHDHPVRTLH